ncbi:MAG: hypothetical protein DRH26_11730 [Deltaproteobacteria bacterium]|nr:MAG: hypothetical protein DRH26_11730 [Deltaproteobacteria bacterium]
MSKFTEAIPEDIRENEHLAGIEDTGTLASKFVETMSKPTDFTSLLPEDLRENETFKDMDVGKLATSYLDIQGKVPVIPEKPDEYSFDFPEGVSFDEAEHALFKDFALEVGLTKDQFARLNDFDVKRIGRVMESYEAQRKETWSQIKQETGLEEDEIEKQTEEVGRALGLEKLMERADLKADPDWVKAMLDIKKKISPDVLKLASAGGKTRPTGPDGSPRLVFKDMD